MKNVAGPDQPVNGGLLGPPNRSGIRQTLDLLFKSGDVLELRVPKAGRQGTISGYFDDADQLAIAAADIDGDVPAIYVTLNPCVPALLARAANRLRNHVEITTSDAEILRRRWLLIDCDPRRPAGISSTETEHGRAIAVACGIWDELRLAGFPDPVVCDSGNGAHLLYRIALPNTPEATLIVQRLLAGIASRCATDDVAVDTAVFNAARITKLYGTMACKGDSTSDRPHRRSRILEIPQRLETLRLGAE